MQTEITIISILLPFVIGILLFKDLLFTNKLQISNTQEQLLELASTMYSELNGNKFVLSAGELNYKAYMHFKQFIEKILEKNSNAHFTIFCGPFISLDDHYINYLDDSGKLLEEKKKEWHNIHPILDLLHRFPDQITLKLKTEKGGNHFFYSIDDKVAWNEEEHEPFEEAVSYFRKDAGKSTFNVLEKMSNEYDNKSLLINPTNAANLLVFKTEKMFRKYAA